MGPALLAAPAAQRRLGLLGAALAGGFVLAPLPLGVTMAHPHSRGRSMVASLMMGFAYGLGSHGRIGKLAASIQMQLFWLHGLHSAVCYSCYCKIAAYPQQSLI